MVVVDTSVWIGYFNGQETAATAWLDAALGHHPIIVGDLVLAELLQGFSTERDARRARVLLDRLDFVEMAGREVAIESARNFRRLRAQGVSVRKTVDMLIGTFCAMRGYALLHADRDFDRMSRLIGLQIVRPH